jgi:hypothetical protein
VSGDAEEPDGSEPDASAAGDATPNEPPPDASAVEAAVQRAPPLGADGWTDDAVAPATDPKADEPADDPADEQAPEALQPPSDADTAELREYVQRAIGQVRSEARKAAAVPALVDGVVVLLAVNLLLTLFRVDLPGPAWLDLGLPVVAGLAAGVGEFLVRQRRPLVEQFEAVNPEVREALRTARDVAADGADTQMARRLYADVLAGLRGASSDDLVPTAQVAVSVVLVLVLAVSTVGVTAAGIDLGPEPTTEGPGGGTNGTADISGDSGEYDGLRDGDAVLGEETDVSEGDNEQDVVIGGSTGGSGEAGANDGSFDTGGFSSDGSYDAQQAGFDAPDDVENADIIREYNLRIRDDDEDP